MIVHRTYNEFHLGDNLIHLNFLRRVALQHPEARFIHFLHPCHISPLIPIADVKTGNLNMSSIGAIRAGGDQAINCWKNAGDFWASHPLRDLWAEFHVEFFKQLAQKMGVESPIKTTLDLLLDYPGMITGHRHDGSPFPGDLTLNVPEFDILFVNSNPCSGQFMSYDSEDCLDPMIAALIKNGLRVITTKPSKALGAHCTRDYAMSISQIGKLSLTTPYHIMVATGPMWPTFNIWNTNTTKLRVLMLGNGEQLRMPVPMHQAATIADAWKFLEREGLL